MDEKGRGELFGGSGLNIGGWLLAKAKPTTTYLINPISLNLSFR
jgi:hypothetical protein